MDFARNKMIYEITSRLEALTMNTVVSGFMEYTNKMIDVAKNADGIDKESLETLITLLAPFTPHIAEEMWREIGHDTSVFEAGWPVCDESKLTVTTVEIPVQINGKVKDSLSVGKEEAKDEVLAKAKALLGGKIEGKTIVKEIYVPGRIVNFVVK